MTGTTDADDPGAGITITVDVEDHRPDPSWPFRVPAMLEVLLEWCERRSVRMTAFVVGSLAEQYPGVVARLAAADHEIALHNWRHEPLTALDPSTFRNWVRRGKAVLEDQAGQPVGGFRAPTGSLVPATYWCTEVLAEEDYTYSSSALPLRSPLYGYAGIPRSAFRWPSGLIETSGHTLGVGHWRLPFGGTYLRVLPWPVTAVLSRLSPPPPYSGVYVHPYDLDTEEPYWRVPDARWFSRLLWVGRAGVLSKLDAIVDTWGAAAPYGERLTTIAHSLPTFVPPGSARSPTTRSATPG